MKTIKGVVLEPIRVNYIEYLKQPLGTRREYGEIYNNKWIVIFDDSHIAPHPHRHYTFAEFVNMYDTNTEFRERFTIEEVE